jgi:holo-[acyl-carrier protein] synthase
MKGVGIDIEEIARFSEKKYDKNKLFYKKIFTDSEIEFCLNQVEPYQHFTARFCAKEAAIKAVSDKNLKFTEIEVSKNKNKPILNIPNEKNVIVSISHTRKYATAVVIIF